jgi:hypothetical protein
VKGNISPEPNSWNLVYADGKWQHYDGTFTDKLKNIEVLGVAKGYSYTDDSPALTMFTKEVYIPGSTL